MKITALGIYGPFPKAGGHASSSYLVEYKNTAIVVDFGSGALTALQSRVDPAKIDHIVLTHFHYDHTSDLFPLAYLCEINGHKYNLVAPRDESQYAKTIADVFCYDLITVDENSTLTVGDLRLTFKKMKHPVPTLAVIVEGDKRVAFGGDTVYNDNIPEMMSSVDVAFLDCSKPSGFKGPHMNVDIAKALAKKFPSVRIITTHLNPDYDPAADLAGSPVEVVEEGKTYVI